MINNYFEDDQYQTSNSIYTHPIYRTSLHIGDINAALDTHSLMQSNIRTVITAAAGMDHIQYQPQTQIKHIVYPLLDIKSENISKHFNSVYQLIQQQLETSSVLVHCAAGISRSATLVIAYLMRHQLWTFRQAIAFVRQKRPTVCPNLGFERQLKEYQHFLSRQNMANLQRKGPRTSQESKHTTQKGKSSRLPEIISLGRTQLRGVLLDPFAPVNEARTSHRARPPQTERNYPQTEELPLKLKPLKAKRAKSLMQRQQRRQDLRDVLGLGPIGAHSVLVRRLNLIENGPPQRPYGRKPVVHLALGLFE